VDPAGLLIDEAGCTPTYIKPMLQEPAGERELHRLDIQNRRPPAPALEAELLKRLRALLPTVDAVIVADQVTRRNCGSVTDGVRREICTLAAAHPAVTCLVDSRAHVGEFDSLWVKANRSEVARAFGLAPDVDLPLTELARLCQAWSTRVARPVFCTLAADGLLMAADTVTHLPAIPQSGPIDVCGAGDSTLAGIALALCAGATPAEAAQVGMLVASLTVQQLGTTGTATPAEVLARFTDAGDGLVAQAVG
jgi:bifunctional ADP-heptose synthase (sugar kinase/adenylyltransferase)